jgi:hypothetical protein
MGRSRNVGIDLHVVGYIPPDEKWYKMKVAYNACEAAGVIVPDDIAGFFGGEDPNTMNGAMVDIARAVRRSGDDDDTIIDVDVAELPNNVRIVRFSVSY